MTIKLPHAVGERVEIDYRGVHATIHLEGRVYVVEVDGRETGSFIRDGERYVARTGRGERSRDTTVASLEDAVFYATRW
ncbi:hypothetical protein [Microbacterium sp. NPDC055455]